MCDHLINNVYNCSTLSFSFCLNIVFKVKNQSSEKQFERSINTKTMQKLGPFIDEAPKLITCMYVIKLVLNK